MSSLAFLDFGLSELILVGVVALLVFGGNLPDVMRTLGRNYAKLRQALREFTEPVRSEINRVHDLPSRDRIVRQTLDEVTSLEPGQPTGAPDEPDDGGTSRESEAEGPAGSIPRNAPRDPEPLDEGPLV